MVSAYERRGSLRPAMGQAGQYPTTPVIAVKIPEPISNHPSNDRLRPKIPQSVISAPASKRPHPSARPTFLRYHIGFSFVTELADDRVHIDKERDKAVLGSRE